MKQKILEIGSIVVVIVLIIVGVMLTSDDSNVDEVLDDANVNDEVVIKDEKNISIFVFDKENKNVYSGDVATEEKFLIDVLEKMDGLDVVSEDGSYGAYIVSIMGISQGDNYYWTYYIDDEYASVGVSGCEIEDGKTYNFKIEKYDY